MDNLLSPKELADLFQAGRSDSQYSTLFSSYSTSPHCKFEDLDSYKLHCVRPAVLQEARAFSDLYSLCRTQMQFEHPNLREYQKHASRRFVDEYITKVLPRLASGDAEIHLAQFPRMNLALAATGAGKSLIALLCVFRLFHRLPDWIHSWQDAVLKHGLEMVPKVLILCANVQPLLHFLTEFAKLPQMLGFEAHSDEFLSFQNSGVKMFEESGWMRDVTSKVPSENPLFKHVFHVMTPNKAYALSQKGLLPQYMFCIYDEGDKDTMGSGGSDETQKFASLLTRLKSTYFLLCSATFWRSDGINLKSRFHLVEDRLICKVTHLQLYHEKMNKLPVFQIFGTDVIQQKSNLLRRVPDGSLNEWERQFLRNRPARWLIEQMLDEFLVKKRADERLLVTLQGHLKAKPVNQRTPLNQEIVDGKHMRTFIAFNVVIDNQNTRKETHGGYYMTNLIQEVAEKKGLKLFSSLRDHCTDVEREELTEKLQRGEEYDGYIDKETCNRGIDVRGITTVVFLREVSISVFQQGNGRGIRYLGGTFLNQEKGIEREIALQERVMDLGINKEHYYHRRDFEKHECVIVETGERLEMEFIDAPAPKASPAELLADYNALIAPVPAVLTTLKPRHGAWRCNTSSHCFLLTSRIVRIVRMGPVDTARSSRG